MPGYLGNEKQFSVKFSKPILSSRDPKSSLKEQEAGNSCVYYNSCILTFPTDYSSGLIICRYHGNGSSPSKSTSIHFAKNERRCFEGLTSENNSSMPFSTVYYNILNKFILGITIKLYLAT